MENGCVGEKIHFLAKMSRTKPYACKQTTAFGGLANFILIDKQSKEKFDFSPTPKKETQTEKIRFRFLLAWERRFELPHREPGLHP